MTWSSSNPCPGCRQGRGQQAVQCVRCLAMGCEDERCVHGGAEGACTVCYGRNTKVRLRTRARGHGSSTFRAQT